METYKCFSLIGTEIKETIRVSGEIKPTISLGQMTWFNGFNILPVILPNNLTNYWQANKEVYISLARIKRKQIFASNGYIYSRKRALVLFSPKNENGLEALYQGEPEQKDFPGLVIASGYLGHLHQKKIYKSKEFLALVPSFSVFSVLVKKEGQKVDEKYFIFNGQKIEEINLKNFLRNEKKRIHLSA